MKIFEPQAMTEFTCIRCHEPYDALDGLCEWTGNVDEGWSPLAERCYHCHLDWCYEMYGGMLEPCIVLNGIQYLASGPLPPSDEMAEPDYPSGNDDFEVPF